MLASLRKEEMKMCIEAITGNWNKRHYDVELERTNANMPTIIDESSESVQPSSSPIPAASVVSNVPYYGIPVIDEKKTKKKTETPEFMKGSQPPKAIPRNEISVHYRGFVKEEINQNPILYAVCRAAKQYGYDLGIVKYNDNLYTVSSYVNKSYISNRSFQINMDGFITKEKSIINPLYDMLAYRPTEAVFDAIFKFGFDGLSDAFKSDKNNVVHFRNSMIMNANFDMYQINSKLNECRDKDRRYKIKNKLISLNDRMIKDATVPRPSQGHRIYISNIDFNNFIVDLNGTDGKYSMRLVGRRNPDGSFVLDNKGNVIADIFPNVK